MWYRFGAGKHPGEIRAGWQVISWGESTFIQGGVNAVNPVDVSALRVLGAELRDALAPEGAVTFRITPCASTSLEAFEADPRTPAAAESYLRRALEVLLDLGRHVPAKAFGQPAAEYRDIPRYLAEHGVIDEAGAVRWLKMAGYRNRMVRFYAEISRADLFGICAAKQADIESAVGAIRAWMAAHPELVDTSL